MSLTEIIKNQEFFKKLTEKKEKNNLSNAVLFFCEDEKTCKYVLILSALMLQYPTFELMDEKCAEFVKIENGADLDVKVFPKGEKLLVADSGEIVADAHVKPINMPYKIFLINNFDNSTEEAQNKLLKVLEEPPKNVYFLLSAKSEDRVLPTIKSRCDKIKISPFAKEELENLCQDTLALILGGGYLGKTLELAGKDDLKSIANLAVDIFCEMKSSKDVIKYSKKVLEEKENLDLILQILSLAIEDMLKLKCESENLCKLKPYLSDLQEVEPEFSVQALCEITKVISSLREKIEFNANLTVAIDNFLLKILEVKYLCK
ncbi:MAG: hypothetical protein J6K39_03675 [Clostridia bacterium]|nr:hypothetical protein [Clostridia bacterium]